VKLLVDMNLSPQWVDRLNAAGLPAVHWSRVGRMDAADIEIMAYAAKHDYVVLTHDLDFSAILAATQGIKPSVYKFARTTSAQRPSGSVASAVTPLPSRRDGAESVPCGRSVWG
jgi:predicted nuclease of predicted toxin-antitoxin system